jgi:glycosyltransferase involved in cell wall biosynthesis
MSRERPEISVCICTYRRPLLLTRLLENLREQETGGLFRYSMVVVDNDRLETARGVVAAFASTSKIPIAYCVEPRQGIALARNRAVEHATGDFVAFIDDDEFPAERWLQTLLKACLDHDVDGVVGPVKRYFDEEPPKWVAKGNFYQRRTYPTGLVIDWRKGRTNNVLLKKRSLDALSPPFRPELRTGEDIDCFRRMADQGRVFVWCDEAVAYEVVPPARWKRMFMVRRALLQGAFTTVVDPAFGVRDVAKSLIAVPVYAVALPFALALGHHRFMSLVVKLSHHVGELLALLGMNPVKEPYVTE